MGAAAGAAFAGPVLGGMIGAQQAGADRRAANAARQQALAQFQGIVLPELDQQMYELYDPSYAGDYQAMLENAVQLDPSAYENISIDPRFQDAQMTALQQLSELGELGLSQGEKAAAMELQRQASAEGRSQNAAIMQEMARRGTSGGGQELAARLAASQAATDRLSQHGNQLAQMAQQRAMEAISQGANLAGQARGQSFEEQARSAEAADLLNRWSAQNSQQVQQRNVASTNQANLRNLQEKQRLGEATTANRNIEEQRRATLPGEQFDRQLALAGAKAGINTQQGTAADKSAAERAQMWAGIGSGAGQAFATLANKDK